MFLTDFWKILRYQISWKSVQLSCPMWMDRLTDMTKLTVTFCNFANAPNKHTNKRWWEIQFAVTSRKNSSQFLSHDAGFTGESSDRLTGYHAIKTLQFTSFCNRTPFRCWNTSSIWGIICTQRPTESNTTHCTNRKSLSLWQGHSIQHKLKIEIHQGSEVLSYIISLGASSTKQRTYCIIKTPTVLTFTKKAALNLKQCVTIHRTRTNLVA